MSFKKKFYFSGVVNCGAPSCSASVPWFSQFLFDMDIKIWVGINKSLKNLRPNKRLMRKGLISKWLPQKVKLDFSVQYNFKAEF